MGLVVSMVTGCAPKAQDTGEVSNRNLVQAGDPKLVRTIGDLNARYTIMARGALKEKVLAGKIEVLDSERVTRALKGAFSRRQHRRKKKADDVHHPNTDSSDSALLFGMPISEFNKPMIFGSVITQVSDRSSVDLGNLKLSDLGPFQVLAIPHKEKDNSFGVALLKCDGDCSKIDELKALIDIPVAGIDPEKKLIYLDLASLGMALDLAVIRQGDPSLERFKSKASKTVKFDYSQSTLVFDIEAHLVENAKPDDTNKPETVITNRWYMRPVEGLNPNFVSRGATPGVGFFMTDTGPKPLIQRWDFDLKGESEGIKYYIKNVPQKFQHAFASSFEEWNQKLLPIIGKKVFNYEFIPENDPRNELLVAGDIRYNILEWDLVNRASYGGLGPSIANPMTGEIFHANVLVQGPTVVQIYTRWFEAQKRATELKDEGKESEAELYLTRAHAQLEVDMNETRNRKFELTFAGDEKVKIRAQDPSFEDPLMSRDDFDSVPEGYDFDTYMFGYFHDMVTHELGHDLGLRHNFKGNLGADHEGREVSRSIMEYLGRGYRYLDKIGEYDLMAIAYGYKGILPTHLDWFCTDDEATRDLSNPERSPECTPNDATDDPFSFFISRFTHALDLAIAKGSKSAPVWTLKDMKPQLNDSVVGVGSYALAADKTANTWTNFFKASSDRPSQSSEVKSYVLTKVKQVLCDPNLESELSLKENEEAKSKARENLIQFRSEVSEILLPVFKAEELACSGQLL